MRLVAWNTNYNNRRRTYDDVMTILAPLHADLTILSEVALPAKTDSLMALIGEQSPGLVVVASNGLELTSHSANHGALPLASAFTVSGRIEFNLVATWPVKYQSGPSYHKILMETLVRFADVISARNSILAGDLNTSSSVSGQELSHVKFTDEARRLGITSVYHENSGELFGNETAYTFRNGSRDFHIDYCFVSRLLVPAAAVTILRGTQWHSRSDHFPLVLDIPDAAFA